MNIVPVICPQCGAQIVAENIKSDDFVSCSYCRTTIHLEKNSVEQSDKGLIGGVDMRDLVERNKFEKLRATKEFRDRTGLDLKASKQAVDEAFEKWGS